MKEASFRMAIFLACILLVISSETAVASPGIIMDVVPINDSVFSGENATYIVNVTSITTEEEFVELSIADPKPGWTYTFDPANYDIAPSEIVYSNLIISVPSSASGDYYHDVIANASWMGILWEQAIFEDVQTTVVLKGVITSCDSTGNETNQFAPKESVYVKGIGLEADTTYRIWIQRNSVTEGQVLNVSEDPSGIHELVITDENGTFGPTKIWDIPEYAMPTYDNFDIVADKQADGDDTGYYNSAFDVVDLFDEVGFVAPVPELGTLALFSMGLIVLLGYVLQKR